MTLTDNEIIKAWECCNKPIGQAECTKCSYFETKNSCTEKLINDTIALINRTTAENKDLFYKLTGVMHFVNKWLEGDELKGDEVQRACTMREKLLRITEQQNAEVERLHEVINGFEEQSHKELLKFVDLSEKYTNAKAEIERLNKEIDRLSQCVMYHDGQIADAIKEFAERLIKEYENIDGQYVDRVMLDIIDNLVKEMVGE